MKLHLPKMLCVALLAAVCGTAWAATEYNGVTYSGNIYTLETTASGTFHNRTFSNYYKNAEGTWTSSKTWGGAEKKYYLGANTTTTNTSDGNDFWRFAFGDGAGKYSTLRLTGATSAIYNEAQFSPFTLGGLIVESGTGSYTIGRAPAGKDCAITLQAENGKSANMSIGADTNVSVGANAGKNTFTVATGGTWNIATGKTLTVARFTNTGNPTAATSGGAFIVNANQTINLTGGGTVDIKTADTTLNSGASFNVAEGSTLKLSGAVSVEHSNGSITDRARELGNGLGSADISATIATGSGTVNTDAVTSWTLSDYTGSYDAATHTLSYNGDSNTYYFYNNGEGVSISDAAGAKYVVIDTLNTESAFEMGDGAHTFSSLTINSGLVTTTHSETDTDHTGFIKNGDVIINSGATLRVAGGHDALGYTANTCVKSVTLNGSAEGTATLDLAQTTDYSATMKSNVIMNGHAAITGGKGFNTYGGAITVSGTDNSIEKMLIRDAVTVTVSAGSELTIDTVSKYVTNTTAVMTLAGRGTTTVNKASSFGGVNLTGGSLVLKADATMTTLTTGEGSANSTVTVAEGATLNIGGELRNSWGIKTLTVNGTINTTDFIVSTGGMVNTINGKGTINANSLKVANQTVKAAFSGVTLNLGSGGVTTDTTKTIEFSDMTVGVREGSEGWSATVNTISLAGTNTGTDFHTEDGQTITLSGNLSGAGKLVKSGEGTLVLSGNNTYTGDTVVNGGTLELNHANALGTGALVLNNGIVTAETALNVTMTSLTLNAGNTITLGADHDGQLTTSAMTVNGNSTVNADLVFAENSVLAFNGGSVTLGCTIDFGTGTTIALGTAYHEDLTNNGMTLLFSGVDAVDGLINGLENVVVTGAFADGHLVAVKQADNSYNIYATPEPATATLSLLALAGLMARRKRH